MARPPLALGTWGDVRVYPRHYNDKCEPDRYRAMANYRDYDGRTRLVQRSGSTENAAKNALRIALKERSTLGGGTELTAASRFRLAADLWIARFAELVNDESRSPGSLDTYRGHLDRHVLPALGELRLAEITTPLLDNVISKIRRATGAPTARSCRTVISGVLGLAVRHGALRVNPVREIERIEGKAKKQPRALAEVERTAFLDQLRADERAVAHDLPDLVTFMLATGVRIGEALAVIWSEFDQDVGAVEITSTIIRVKGKGMLRKRTKSRAGERNLLLPSWGVAMLRRRFMTGVRLSEPIFPDSLGGFRDPANTRRALREARGKDALAWVTSHSFRKTTATILDAAGLSARIAADQLGHSRVSMTQDVYFGRKIIDPRAAAALESALDGPKEQKRG